MGKHFLSVLGTNLYEPVIYEDGEFQSSEQIFIQAALIERFRKEIAEDEDSRITIFLTQGAKDKNYNNRLYEAWEAKSAEKWTSARKEDVIEGSLKKGLEEELRIQFPDFVSRIETVSIEDAQTEEQIWDVFSKIYDSLREGDEIIFDITHSFRSIPMLAMTVINYAKILKNCSLKGIYYGAYEAAKITEVGKIAPINNLTMYNDILEWTNAANTFMRFGNASMIKGLFDEKLASVPNEEKRKWSSLRYLVGKIETLSDTIQTCRGVDGDELNIKPAAKSRKSVKAAYASYREELIKKETPQRNIKPLVPLFEKVEEKFSVFDKENNYEIGMAVTAWSIENGMIQQGYTSLEETIKTWICHCYGLNEVEEGDRDGVAGYLLNQLKEQEKNKSGMNLKDPDERWESVRTNAEEKYQDAPERLEKARKIVKELDYDLISLTGEIKDARNDINHFGMRREPKDADWLKSKLKEYFERFRKIVERKEAGIDD